jgi:hypothetical protein
LKEFWFVFALVVCGESAWAGDLSALIRPLSSGAQMKDSYPLSKLSYRGQWTEAYIYTDVLRRHSDIKFKEDLLATIRYFDQEVCNRFSDVYGFSPIRPGQEKIILLFDENLSFKGFHSRILEEQYRRDFILIDINENLDSNALKYRFPHELQHLVRYHYQPAEEDWLNEGLSVFTEYLFNEEFPILYLEKYNDLAGRSLFGRLESENRTGNYFNNFLFIYYLYQHYGGMDLIRELMRSPQAGAENIGTTLQRFKNKQKGLKSDYYSLEKAFINYQLALILNPYREVVESDGFFDLKLDLANLPSEFHKFSARTGILPLETAITLDLMTSHFYDLETRCFAVEMKPKTKLLAVLINMSSNTSDQAIQVLKNNKIYCVDELRQVGQFIAVINPDSKESQPFIIRRAD